MIQSAVSIDHGAMDAGNTKLRGGSLDFGSATFQLDTAPRFWLNPDEFKIFSQDTVEKFITSCTFGYEYLAVADNLDLLFPEFDREIFNRELEQQRLIQLMLLFGFTKKESKEFLKQSPHREQLSSFYKTWWNLGKYFYWGAMNGRNSVQEPLSLIDIFAYLKIALTVRSNFHEPVSVCLANKVYLE